MAFLTDLLKQVFTTTATGAVALRAIISGDQNLGGGYISNDQTTTNMMSKGTVYHFDGVNDFIGSIGAPSVFMGATGFIHSKINPTLLTTSNILTMNDAGSNNDNMQFRVVQTTGVVLATFKKATTTQWQFTSDNALSADTEVDVTLTHNGTTPLLYFNGILQAVTYSTSTDKTAWVADFTTSDTTFIGKYSLASDGGYFSGEIAEVMLGNFAPTAAQIKDLISGNIPFKWQYGSQTAQVVGDDSDMDTVGNWATVGASTITGGYDSGDVGHAATLRIEAGDATEEGARLDEANFEAGAGVIDVEYLVTFQYKWISPPTVDPPVWTAGSAAGANFDDIDKDAVGWTEYNSRGIVNNWSNGLYIMCNGLTGGSAADELLIDNVQIIRLGAVALYDQTSISETYWYDKANGNDGAVTGASVLNPPSVTPLLAMHMNTIRLQPGASAGTNINCTARTDNAWNYSALTDTANLAKSGSGGSFSLSADGITLTINTAKESVGVLGYGIKVHDVNSSSVTEMYFAQCNIVSGNLTFLVTKRGSSAGVDLTTILDAGDLLDFWVQYVTAT